MQIGWFIPLRVLILKQGLSALRSNSTITKCWIIKFASPSTNGNNLPPCVYANEIRSWRLDRWIFQQSANSFGCNRAIEIHCQLGKKFASHFFCRRRLFVLPCCGGTKSSHCLSGDPFRIITNGHCVAKSQSKGPSVKYVCKLDGFFDSMSVIWADLQYYIHATTLTTSTFEHTPPPLSVWTYFMDGPWGEFSGSPALPSRFLACVCRRASWARSDENEARFK